MIRYFFLSCFFCASLFSNSFVSYQFSSGRLGDCLLTYLHAKWLSYKYQISLLYKPFPYSSALVLHQKELYFHPFYIMRYSLVVLGDKEPIPSRDWHIYECPYFPEKADNEWGGNFYNFPVDWSDKAFKKIAREMIAPTKSLNILIPKPDRINVALHVREGGGFDSSEVYFQYPLKLPPLSFYIEGLLKVIEEFKELPIYCYLFTDALEPEKLVCAIQKFIPSDVSIVFDYRRENNHHTANVLEDFFSFFEFDALVHPCSNFSLVPARIGDFAITYCPIEFLREGEKILITESYLNKNEELYQKAIARVKK